MWKEILALTVALVASGESSVLPIEDNIESRAANNIPIQCGRTYSGNPTANIPFRFDYKGPKPSRRKICQIQINVPSDKMIGYNFKKFKLSNNAANGKFEIRRDDKLILRGQKTSLNKDQAIFERLDQATVLTLKLDHRRRFKKNFGVVLELWFATPPNPSSGSSCGVPPFGSIVGGTPASVGEIPYQAGIKYIGANQVFCGATLVDDFHVLTAAHCIVPSNFQVVMGSLNAGNAKVYNVAEVSVHAGYNADTTDNDIALIRLKKPVTFTNNLYPACLTQTEPSAGTNVIVSGWGVTASQGSQPSSLLKVDVTIIDRVTCENVYNPGEITSNMICAGVPEGGKDSCQGDSGGPLVERKADGTFVQVGVVSWGYGCALPGVPGVYTNLARYFNWIKSKGCTRCQAPMATAQSVVEP